MSKDHKNFVIQSKRSGLFVFQREDGSYCLSGLKEATRFTKKEANTAADTFHARNPNEPQNWLVINQRSAA